MKEKKSFRYSFRVLSKEQRLYFALLVFFCLLGQFLFLDAFKKQKEAVAVSGAENFGESVSTGIALFLNQSVQTTQTLRNLYIEYDEDLYRGFDRICKRFMEDNSAIGSIYIAPDGIIQAAYPDSVEDSCIGFNMLEDPEQKESALKAIVTRRTTVAGPHALVEGGAGFIIRDPIFENGEFKAFTICVLDWDEFVRQVIQRIDSTNEMYHFGVWKEDNSYVLTDEYGFIFKDCDRNLSRKVDVPVLVPNDEWHLCVEPIDGWIGIKDMHVAIIGSSLIILLILFAVYTRQCDNSNRLNTLKYDRLTGLKNRISFYDEIKKLRANDLDGSYDVIVADIEGFKVVNSIYGSEAGDKILKHLAQAFSEEECIVVARYGGDQFIMLFESEKNKGIEYLTNRDKYIKETAPVSNFNIKYGFYGHIDLTLPANLICDRALLAARSILHNYEKIVADYNGPISIQNMKEHMLESSFQKAIDEEQFQVWYQPKFDAITEKLVGCEALVRWRLSDKMVPPNEFIHVFEDDGLIVKLDEFVFRKVCETLKYVQMIGGKTYPVSINISRASLNRKGTIQHYADIVKEYGIPIECVPLEITETTKTRDFEIKEFIEELKKEGFKIHMDDFGSGLSSLEALNILPFDVIKLDKSLIDYIGNPGGNELLRHVIELAHFKGMKVVAEGVEDKTQLEFLRSLKCDYIQGYYFSKPLDFEDSMILFTKLYKENRLS